MARESEDAPRPFDQARRAASAVNKARKVRRFWMIVSAVIAAVVVGIAFADDDDDDSDGDLGMSYSRLDG